MLSLVVNGTKYRVDADPDEPLLWTLRDGLNLLGTKYGCGAGLCGACCVLVDGIATRSCSVATVDVAGASITTIENSDDAEVDLVRRVWTQMQVPQCGYCQAGFILAVAAELKKGTPGGPAAIADAATNLCRCGTQARIQAALIALREARP